MVNLYNKFLVTVLFLLIPLGGLHLYAKSQGVTIGEIFYFSPPIVHVGEIPVTVEVVSTPQARARGLSNRESLEDLGGMFFVFDTTEFHSIWMKDMYFPIDIIWISEDLVVVDIHRSVQPDTYPSTFKPRSPVRYALETNARYTETFGINIGDKVRLPKSVAESTGK